MSLAVGLLPLLVFAVVMQLPQSALHPKASEFDLAERKYAHFG